MRKILTYGAGAALAVVAVMAACSFDPSGLGGDDGGALLPDSGFSIDAAVDAYNGPDAEPGCVTQCLGANQFRDCNAGGMVFDCPLGCVSTGGAHCGVMSPSNGVDMSHLGGVTNGITIPAGEDAFIDVDTGEIWIGVAKIRDVGTGLGSGLGFYELPTVNVFAFDFLTLEGDSNLRLQGDKPVAIVTRGAVSIAGLIDIAGGCMSLSDVWCGGAGGGAGSDENGMGFGCAPGGDGGDDGGDKRAGGGGGGLGQNGASGGAADGGDVPAGTGGVVTALCPGPTLVPLKGGSGGGHGGDGNGGRGGGGGGGLQISSFTSISITDPAGDPPGAIWAGGAGGEEGVDKSGGGGGGSGGAILLEAPSITIMGGIVAANGGGGGHGDGDGDGEYGLLSTSQADGGGGGGRAGGKGGALGKLPESPNTDNGAGGGGGGYGIIRLNVPAASLSLSGAVISPAHTRGEPSVQ